MKKALLAKLSEALVSVLPVAALVLILSFTPLAPLSWLQRTVFFVSALMLVLGIGLFNLGADLAMTPMGRHIGEGLTKSGKLGVLVMVCFLMGVLITVAEPDLSVLAGQISAVVNPTLLIVTVGVGVGLLEQVSKQAWLKVIRGEFEGKEYLVFDGAPIREVIKKMERWYGVDITVADARVMNNTFTASFQSESLQQVLTLLDITCGIKSKIKSPTEVELR